MRNIIVICFFVFLSTSAFSQHEQNVTIDIKVTQAFSAQAKLFIYSGSQVELVDSSRQHEQGRYIFNLPANCQSGLYKVDIGKSISFDLIVNNESEIDVYTTVFAPNDSLKSSKSIENQTFWDYQRLKKKNDQHLWFIRSLMDYYPDSSMMFQMLATELYRLDRNLQINAFGTYNSYPNLLASRLILLEQKPILPPDMAADQKKSYQIDNWFYDFLFTDIRLTSSPAFSSRIWSYIELLFSDMLDKEEQDEAFIQGITTLMETPMDISVRQYVRALLIDGFKDSDYQSVVEFLETTPFKDLKPLREPSLKIKKQKTGTEIGQKAYDFMVELKNGKSVKLSKVDAKYKLVIFWSTWCPHCIETLPRIADVYSKYQSKGLEIVAISIDDEEALWQNYINKLHLNWINLREPYQPDSKIISNYKVEETPKMFLLSSDLTIISLPSTKRQLEVKLKRLLRD